MVEDTYFSPMESRRIELYVMGVQTPPSMQWKKVRGNKDVTCISLFSKEPSFMV